LLSRKQLQSRKRQIDAQEATFRTIHKIDQFKFIS